MPSLALRRGPLAALCIGLALAAVAAPASAAERSGSATIDPGQHAPLEFPYQEDAAFTIRYEIGVRQGPNIDVMVMDNANYQSYRDDGSFQYVASWSVLDTGSATQEFTLEEKGTWYIVLDHTGDPEDGASPATVNPQSATVEWTVQTNLAVREDVSDKLPGPGAGLAAAALAAASLAGARLRRE